MLMHHEFCCVNINGVSWRTWKNKLNNIHIPCVLDNQWESHNFSTIYSSWLLVMFNRFGNYGWHHAPFTSLTLHAWIEEWVPSSHIYGLSGWDNGYIYLSYNLSLLVWRRLTCNTYGLDNQWKPCNSSSKLNTLIPSKIKVQSTP